MANLLLVTTLWLSRDFTLAGHALLHPSTAALTERGGNYISANVARFSEPRQGQPVPTSAGFTTGKHALLRMPHSRSAAATTCDAARQGLAQSLTGTRRASVSPSGVKPPHSPKGQSLPLQWYHLIIRPHNRHLGDAIPRTLHRGDICPFPKLKTQLRDQESWT